MPSNAHSFNTRTALFILGVCALLATRASAADKPVYIGAACTMNVDDFFTNEVWPKVGAQTCLECHKSGGDAEDSDFILTDPQRTQGAARDQVLRRNRDAFAPMAT